MQRRQLPKQRDISARERSDDNAPTNSQPSAGRNAPRLLETPAAFALLFLVAALGLHHHSVRTAHRIPSPSPGSVAPGGGAASSATAPSADGRDSGRPAAAAAAAAARIPNGTETLFPPLMFYTAANLTEVGEQGRAFRSNCEALNPNYEVRAYDDRAARDFVAERYPEFLALYDDLDNGVMRSDMWRYLILHHFGGVYLDFDVNCKRPIDEWGRALGIDTDDPESMGKLGAMVGIEYRRPAREYHNFPPRLQFAQWTMAGKPGHPIFYRTVEMINKTIAEIRAGGKPPGDAVYITGPVMFSRAVVDFMVQHGRLRWDQVVKPRGCNDILVNDSSILESTDMMVGDLAILHQDAFAYRGGNRGAARDEDHETVYARHWYKGSWKPKGWRKRMKLRERGVVGSSQ